jgi:serine/threonine protein kinase
LSLEFVDGPTLSARLGKTPQPARAAAELVEAVARALAVAHQGGIVHRDLKPGNILLARPLHDTASEAEEFYGTPKVTDFGLAKRLDTNAGQTRSGDFVGTPSYMAPEQALGQNRRVGPAADIYALGAILYEMLTGRPPFLAESVLETVRLAVQEEAVPLRRLQPSVPRDLETICLKCLHKDPSGRYASAGALANDLRRYLDGEPILARPPGPVARLGHWCRRYPVAASLLAGITLCLIFGFWYFSQLTDHLVRSAALESAAQQADLLSEVNDSYAEVVKRVKTGRNPPSRSGL